MSSRTSEPRRFAEDAARVVKAALDPAVEKLLHPERAGVRYRNYAGVPVDARGRPVTAPRSIAPEDVTSSRLEVLAAIRLYERDLLRSWLEEGREKREEDG